MGDGPRWRTWALVATAILGVVTAAAMVLVLGEANRQRERASLAQGRSYGVMVLSRTLAGTIARSEASLGRYVISGDRDQGQLYSDQWRMAAAQLDRLGKLTGRQEDRRRTFAALHRAFDARGAELSVIALSTRYGKNAQALARYYKARGAPSLRFIDRALDGVNRDERRLLDRRTGAALAAAARAATAARVLSVFGMLIVLAAILLGWLVVRALAERATARGEVEAADLRSAELADAVAHATTELRAQEAKLRQAQKMDAVGQLTGGIAHDFNNMLAVVIGGIELARRHADDPVELARHLESAEDGATRAAALTRRLLAFSRDEGLRPEVVDPVALVAGMSELMDRTLGDGVTTRVLGHAANWRVCVDRVQLENALLNLAVNARDAMDGRGDLTVRATAVTLLEHEVGRCRAGEYVALAVADTGCGMAPEVAERVFEPFFTTKEVGRGTGLGMSQVFALVRQQGGEVGLETSAGRGTTVTLYLPRHAEGAATSAAPAPASLPAIPAPLPAAAQPVRPAQPVADQPVADQPRDARRLRILVVEDDPRVLASTVGALKALGHDPAACDDPLVAPDALGDADLVLSDVQMPRQTGPDMVSGLLERRPGLAVLYVTGYAGDAGRDAQYAGHPVLRKPFTLAGLERALGTAMTDRAANDGAAAYRSDTPERGAAHAAAV